MGYLVKRISVVLVISWLAWALFTTVLMAAPAFEASMFEAEALQDTVILDVAPTVDATRTIGRAAAEGAITPFLPDTAWRIGVVTDGLYALDYARLVAAGVPVTFTAPSDFHLLWRGQEVALHELGLADSLFGPGDALIFYGEKFHGTRQDERYTDENVYWLTVDGGTPGLRMVTRSVLPGDTFSTGVCTGTATAEQNLRYWARGSDQPGTTTVWFWNEANSPTTLTRTYPIALSAPLATAGAARLSIEVASANENPGVNPDHHVRLSLNGAALGDFYWEGKIGHIITTSVPANFLQDGENTLQVAYVTDAGHQRVFFDRAHITYQRQALVEEGTVRCETTLAGTRAYTFTGLPTGARLYDVSDTLHPVILLGGDSGPDGLAFVDTAPEGTRYLAETPRAITATRYFPAMDLISPTIGADEIVIAPRHFLDALQAFSQHRASRGLRVRTVAVEDIYPLFNGGVFHPEAIRAFIAHAYANWPDPPLQYVFLVGDGNFNFKNYNPATYGAAPTWIPPYLEFADPNQGDVPVDARFGDVDEDGLPEIAVGRLPAQTVAEVEGYVAKVLAYEQQFPTSWQARALMVADNGEFSDEGFDSLLDRLGTLLPEGIEVHRIYMEDYCSGYAVCPTATQALTEAWNAGAALLTYAGHGSIHRWAHEPLLLNTHLTALSQTTALPFLLSLDCWDGYWMFPPHYHALPGRDVRSIGEWATTVLTQTGAIAAFGPAGLGYADEEEILARAMYQKLFVEGERRLGALTQAGRTAIARTYMARTYTLLGDPALELNILLLDRRVFLPLVMRGP